MKRLWRWSIVSLVVLAAVGAWYAYGRFVAPTHIVLVNYPSFTAARISREIEDQWVDIDVVPLSQLEDAEGAGLIVVFGRGLSLDPQQQALLREYAGSGTAVYVESPTNPNTDVTSLSGDALDRVTAYFAYGGSTNYRNLLAFVRRDIDGKRVAAPEAGAPEPIPRDVLFARNDDTMFDSVASFEAYYRESGKFRADGRKLALVTSVPGPFNANRDHIDAIIDAFEARGFNLYPMASATRRLEFLQQIEPDAVIYMPHGALTLGQQEAALAWLQENQIPLITPLSVFMRHDEWLEDPQGFSGPLLTMNLVLAELDGGIDPFAVVAQYPDENGLDAFEAVPDRLDRFVERVERHLALKRTPDSEKRLAIVFFKGPGEGALSAGGLEVVPSLHRFLLALRDSGYDLGDLPDDLAEFTDALMSQAPVLAPYAAGDMARWLDSGKPAWIDTDDFVAWCDARLGTEPCAAVVEKYGPPPGAYLAAQDGSKLAVARLEFGNVALLPQPLPAVGKDSFKLVHGADVAPPYPYVGAYLWVENDFDADAILHFGTHGSLEFTPGKQVALSTNDWSDGLIGDIPHFYVYTMNNVGEAIIAKRRSYATILSHLSQPIAEAGLTDELVSLRNELDRWRQVEGATKAERAQEIRRLAASLDLLEALELSDDANWSDDEFLALSNFVERQETTRIALGLYTWSSGYDSENARETAVQMTVGPLASALLDLDRLRGVDVSAHEDNRALFNSAYRDVADRVVADVLAGGDTEGAIQKLITAEELERLAAVREALARPDDASLVRGFIEMADAAKGGGAAASAFDQQALMEALIPTLADPRKRELVETWRSEQQLQRAIDSLDPATRARAEKIAVVIPAMKEALALTDEPDMRRLLEELRPSEARAVLGELLDDPDLPARVAAERQAYRTQLVEQARDPDRVELLRSFDNAGNAAPRLAEMTAAELENASKIMQFYTSSAALPDALEASPEPGDDDALLLESSDVAARAQTLIAEERSKRDIADRSFLDAADRILGLVSALPGRLSDIHRSSGTERQAGLAALGGAFIAPSPGGDPVIAPMALPTGRNLVSLDAERTPSEAAWRVGGRLADELLAHYQARHGTLPEKIAVTLWPNEFIQNEGAMVAQVLHLIGAVPVRDPFGRVNDIRLADPATLERPRIDVVVQTAGQFRDLAASRLYLINKAIALAAAEGDNPISESAVAVERALLENGASPLEARALSTERIFGGVNGNYGTGIMGYVENSGEWNRAGEIGSQYLINMNARYGSSEGWGQNTPGLLAAALQGTTAIVQPRSSNVDGPLSLDHMYEFMGGLSRAVETVTGEPPEAYYDDYRTTGSATVTTLADSIAEEMHGTLLNPKYIAALRDGGASSAATFAETFRNGFGWETMRPQAIGDESWNALFDVYVRDKHDLDLRAFFEDEHPQSLQEITAVMLETARKGFWDASDEQRGELAALHAELIETHGAGCSGFVCGNPPLREFIASLLSESAAASYEAQLDEAVTNPNAQDSLVLTERRALDEDAQAEPVEAAGRSRSAAAPPPQDDGRIGLVAFVLAALVLAALTLLALRSKRAA